MAKYTRKDEIFFTDDPRLENAIEKKVYASDNPTNLLQLATNCMWDMTLVAINKDADSRPFVTKVEGIGYKHYDAIILKKGNLGFDEWKKSIDEHAPTNESYSVE